METKTQSKIFFVLVWVFSLIALPWWGTSIVALMSFFVFRSPAVSLTLGFGMDVYYGSITSAFFPFPFLVSAVILSFLVPRFKRQLVFWRSGDA